MTVQGVSIGLTHALEYPETPWWSMESSMERDFGQGVDVIVFGDTHLAMVERHKGILEVSQGKADAFILQLR